MRAACQVNLDLVIITGYTTNMSDLDWWGS